MNIILEWQPFSRVVFRTPVAKRSYFLGVTDLEPSTFGTHVTLTYGRAHGPWYELVVGFVMWILFIKRREGRGLPKLRELIEEDLAEGRVLVPESRIPDADEIDQAVGAALPTP